MLMIGDETHLAALFVLDDDIPVEIINEVLEKVYEESGVYHLWIADDTPGRFSSDHDEATVPPVSPEWQSPFAVLTIQGAFEFISSLPTDTQVTMNGTYIVVLNKNLYLTKDWIMVCKIDEEGTITTAPSAAKNPVLYFDSLSWYLWPKYLERWLIEGKPFLRQ
ncbi:hypothetical protein D6C99_10388 [Aureobasidium pullulans]|nr:hypothetical protein D6C99_10388 [Aureobasidium pullulans]